EVGRLGGLGCECRGGLLHLDLGTGEARLNAPPQCEPGCSEGVEVVRVRVRMAAYIGTRAVRSPEKSSSAQGAQDRVDIRDDHAAPASRHPGQLHDGPREFLDMLEGKR